MDWKYLQAAAFYDNDSFIKDYLEYEELEQDKSTITKILHTAAESCSVKVVQAVVNSPHGMCILRLGVIYVSVTASYVHCTISLKSQVGFVHLGFTCASKIDAIFTHGIIGVYYL